MRFCNIVKPQSLLRSLILLIAWLGAAHAASAAKWESMDLPPGARSITKLANSATVTIGLINSHLYRTTDGSTWEETELTASVWNIGHANGHFWALTVDAIYFSQHGKTWTRAGTLPTDIGTPSEFQLTPFGAICTGRIFDSSTGVTTVTSVLRISSDLENWEPAGALPETNDKRYPSLSRSGVVQGGETTVVNYWVYGDGIPNNWPMRLLAWSNDGGRTWTQSVAEDDQAPETLAYANGVFVGIWLGGPILRSTDDGRSFQIVRKPVPETLYSEVWTGGGRFFTRAAATSEARLYSSIDGETWTDAGTVPVSHFTPLTGAAYGAGRYYLSGMTGEAGLEPFAIVSNLAPPPVLTQQPVPQTIAAGRALHLSVQSTAGTATSYQWQRNGADIPGATAPEYFVPRAASAVEGIYQCVVRNATATILSGRATVTTIPATAGGRLVNLSVNTLTGAGDESVNVGFVVSGPSAKPLLVRAIGPTLADYDYTDQLPDPNLDLFTGGASIASNDDWNTDDGRGLGAFPLPAGSRDAVLRDDLASGIYSIVINGNGQVAGRIVTEVYDANLDSADSLLTNLSARAVVASDQTFIVGFVVGGTTELDLIIRAIGPGLAAHGIENAMGDPEVTLFRGSDVIATNDDWSGDYGQALGAFPLEPGSKDSVLSVRLAPGLYSAHIRSAAISAPGGILLLELYDAD